MLKINGFRRTNTIHGSSQMQTLASLDVDCTKTFDVGNMGLAALVSHAKGKSIKRTKSDGRYSRPDYVTACTSTSSIRIATKQLQPTLNQSITTSNDPLLAAVMWVLKTMDWHYSYSAFSCGENKACVRLNIWICALLPSARQRCQIRLQNDIWWMPEQSSPTQTDGPVHPDLGWGQNPVCKLRVRASSRPTMVFECT